MRNGFNSIGGLLAGIWPPRNAFAILRVAVLALIAANLVAAYFVIWPAGGSPAELKQQLTDLRIQVNQRRAVVNRARDLVKKVETGGAEGQTFVETYFLNQRTSSSDILSELSDDAAASGLQSREASYSYEPVEGSDSLDMMTVNQGFQGTYPQLIQLIHRLDQSKRLLIIESLQASPQQGSPLLNLNIRVNAFVRENAPGTTAATAQGGQP
ncbi:MAG TPA: hypothetical protein VN610_03590 [Bryobacteraceae bacterium]|nr:hypothetical protein [Bryobacteraceae bacterium]